MQKLLLASSLLVLTACSNPFESRTIKAVAPNPAGTLGAASPRHVGETLALQGIAGPGTLTIKNVATGATKAIAVDTTTTGVPLDASTLPDLGQGARVQEFQVALPDPQTKSPGAALFIVADPDVQPFPQPFYQLGGPEPTTAPGGQLVIRPTPGPGAWASKDSTSGPEAFIQQLVERWKLQAPTITHAEVARAEVNLPKFLETAPTSTKFVRYEIHDQFPKYLVPKEFSSSGEADVYTPTSLAVVLTQTDPADLVSLVAR
jgi:hypothetical protein